MRVTHPLTPAPGTLTPGEIAELKDELHHQDRAIQKNAVKKVIAAMTVGKDVSMLFPDVTNIMQTDNLELKKVRDVSVTGHSGRFYGT